jgi:hypothetical protein
VSSKFLITLMLRQRIERTNSNFWDVWEANMTSILLCKQIIILIILILIFIYLFIYLWWGTPPRQGHFGYPSMSGKLRTCVKRPLHTDRVILRLRRRVGLKKLCIPKGIRTLDLMGLPQRLRPLPLEPTP